MGGNSKSKAQVSAYLMSLHVGFCHSVDKVLEIFVKEKSVVKGFWSTNTTLTIDQKNLFGGEKKEGGLLGGLEIMQGRSDQVMREDLANRLGKTAATAPGFRDILSMFFYGAPGLGFMWSNNYPYLHTIWARVTRTKNGGTQWYPEKAEIVSNALGFSAEYPVSLSANSSSTTGVAGFDFSLPNEGTATVVAQETWSWTPYDGYVGFTKDWSCQFGIKNLDTGHIDLYWLKDTYGYNTKAEADAALLGLSITTPTLAPGNYRFFLYDAEVDDNRGTGRYSLTVNCGTPDMNPAHIIRECLTNTDWGMGLPSSQIDDTAFTEAADILYNEGFGLSLMWSGQSDIETFVNEVLNHIDATYGVDPATGKIFIKLIRGGYDLGDLELLNEDNCRITQFNRKALDETTNEVVVTWTNPENEGEETVVVHDLANYAAQGVIVSSSRNYYGIRSSALAIRAALRELNKSAQPIAAFELEASRAAWKFKSGDVVKVSYAEYGLNELPCRITNINYGKPGEMAIKMTLVEDVFEMPDSSYVVTEGSYWEPVVSSPATVNHVLGTTAPYFAVARAMGDADASALTSTQAYSFLLTDSPGLVEVFRPTTDAAGAVAYSAAGTVDPCGYGTLGAGLTQEVTSTVTLATNSNRVILESGVFMLIGGQEICIVESVDPLIVRRGMLDTVPKVWAAGTSVWIFSWDADLNDETENTVGSTVAYHLAPDGTGGAGSLTASVTFSTRAVKPYRPANVKINTVRWPTVVLGPITVSWSHRNRLMETSVPLKWDEASVTPEVGTTYRVTYYEGETQVKTDVVSDTDSVLTLGDEFPSEDPYFANNVLLMPCTGADGSTYIPDVTGKTVTVYGDAKISTAQYRYGGSSLKLDGAGDYLGFAASSDFDFGSGDFTWEAWIYRVAVTEGGYADAIWCSKAGPVGFGIGINPDGKIGLAVDSPSGPDWDIRKGVDPGDPRGSTAIPLSTWTHIAVTRSGTTFSGWVNGALDQTFTSSEPISAAGSGYFLGHWHDGWTRNFNGHFNGIRIKKGVAIYTAPFTPPEMLPILDGSEHMASKLRITVETIRDGIHSEQVFEHTFDRAGYGLQYGNYYGGI